MDQQQRVQVAKRVKERRAELGWSQVKLAEEAGVSENTVISIEAPAKPGYDFSKEKPRDTQEGKLRAVLDALGIEHPNSDIISLEGVPDDVRKFLKVAVPRLKAIEDDGVRARVLADIYPRILVD